MILVRSLNKPSRLIPTPALRDGQILDIRWQGALVARFVGHKGRAVDPMTFLERV